MGIIISQDGTLNRVIRDGHWKFSRSPYLCYRYIDDLLFSTVRY